MNFKFFSPASFVVLFAFVLGTFWGMKIYTDRNREAFLEKQKLALKVLTYKNLFSQAQKQEIAQDLGFVVEYVEVETPEELWERLEKPGPNGSPDLISLFSYQVPLAAQLGWLQAIHRNHLPNLENISPDFVDIPGDPSLHQVAPILWGVSGLVQKTEAGLKTPSWREVLDSPKLKGKVGFPNSTMELLRLGLATAPSVVSGAATSAAANGLQKVLQPWFAFAQFSPQFMSATSLAATSNVILASHGEMAFAPLKDSDWKFSLPVEDATLWILSFALAREPRDERNAYAFLNAMLDRKQALSFVENFHQASTHRGLESIKTLDPRLKPSYLRQIPFESFVLWTDYSRAREVRTLMAEKDVSVKKTKSP